MYLLWLRIAEVLYGVAALAALPGVLYGMERWRRFAIPVASVGFLIHLVSVVETLGTAHRWVPVGIRESESLMALVVAGLFLGIWRFYGTFSFSIFALPAAFFLALPPALGPDAFAFPSNGVKRGWLVIHIALLLAAFVALGFSVIASGLYLLQEKYLKAKMKPGAKQWVIQLDWLPPLDTLERIAHLMLMLGFPCMTVGLMIGSLLAQESVGPAYFLDPKVVASFVMWGVFVMLLFLRRSAGLRGKRAAYLSGAVFVAMIIVWAANVVSQVHKFGAR
jgi:ABC-type uncharacterized transport system permease subunit